MRLKRGVVVLHRGPGVSQVGLARPVVLTGLSARQQQALASLEGGRTVPVGSGANGSLRLDDLAQKGHLEAADAAVEPEPAQLAVGIHGAGAIGLAAARSLARHGHRVEFEDTAPASAESPGVFSSPLPGQTCAGAAVRELLASVPLAQARAGLSQPEAVIAVSMGAPDPLAWLPLLRADIPHVLVTTDEAGVDVGPLVLPGRSACARCVALDRTATDPQWPMLVLQCGPSRRPVVEPHVAETAGAMAAAMVLAWAAEADSWAVNAVWRVEPLRPASVRPAWPHPECGCGAVATTAA